VTFAAPVAEERYRWPETTLRQFRCGALKRADKGLMQMFLRTVTGYSHACNPGTLFSAMGIRVWAGDSRKWRRLCH
jgi:hypothetical protein